MQLVAYINDSFFELVSRASFPRRTFPYVYSLIQGQEGCFSLRAVINQGAIHIDMFSFYVNISYVLRQN